LKTFEETLAHPMLGTARINVYEYGQPQRGWLVTEDRNGTIPVVKTIGFFDDRESALAIAHRRLEELRQQRYGSLTHGVA
jgi:hypothetical protein